MLKCDVSLFYTGMLHYLCIIDFRLHIQHFINAIRRGCGTWKHDKHHRKHQKRKENQCRVLKKGEERSNLHISIVDTDTTEPEYGNRCQVENQHHHRHHKRDYTVDSDGHIFQVGVSYVKALFFMIYAVKCPDNTHSTQAFI